MSEVSNDVPVSDAPEVDSAEMEAQQSPSENQELKEELEEFVLKVNGKEVREKINLKDKERITKALQMEKAAQSAFQERAITAKQLQEIQSDVQEFLQQFTENPLSIVMNPEFNLSKEQKRQLAEAILREDLEESQKTPEQLEYEATKRKYEELLAEKEALEAQRREEEQARLEQEAAIELENEIVQAIEVGSLPRSQYISKKLADLAYIAYSNGIDLSIQDLIPFVKQQYKRDIAEMLGVLDDEEVEMLVSKDRIRAIRNKQIQSVKPKDGAPKAPLKTQDTGSSSKKQEEPQKIKAKDFFRNLGG
jgi:DNA repair exonuclease SbcCD ATPase subunit